MEAGTNASVQYVIGKWADKPGRQFIALGAVENEKPYNVGGDLMTATVKDPWGNVIGFIYNPEFKL